MANVGQGGVSSTTDHLPNVLTISPTIDLHKAMQEDDEGLSVGASSLLSNQAYLVSPSLSNPTLQSLLASPTALQGGQLSIPEGFQIITVSSPSDLLPTQTDSSGRIWHVINPENISIAMGDVAPSVLTADDDYKTVSTVLTGEDLEESQHIHGATTDLIETTATDVSSLLLPQFTQPLPPGCPGWAARMKNCEKIGDYYRGYVDTDMELDILLTVHKQVTQSFWGTRQSPSPAKQSTRFMWKSQYVPWDGVPFVNTGSRAVVMECQYGPRRKGSLAKKSIDTGTGGEYKQTCPARIYIKKVRKFPEYRIDTNLDKKNMKNAMDKAFHDLKQQNIERIGQDRFYIQLPLPSAHEFHDDMSHNHTKTVLCPSTTPSYMPPIVTMVTGTETTATTTVDSEDQQDGGDKHNRLNPMVVQKIREIVAGGEVRVYHVRRHLRMYVVRDLCNGMNDASLPRHDLTLFPTVTDLKNQIHQAVKDIENGTLALTAPMVNVEPMANNTTDENLIQIAELNGWPPVPETVTVTLTQSPGEDGGHVISRIETHLSDGSTQISTSLTPETASLLARLNPSLFPPGSLVQLQNAEEDQQPDSQSGDSMVLTSQSEESMVLDSQSANSLVLGGHNKSLVSFDEIKMETDHLPVCSDTVLTLAQTPDSSSTLTISALDANQSEASNIITTENHSIAEQSSELISVVSMITRGTGEDMEEDLQTDSCEEEL